jgi:hypothetical protein
MSINSSNMPNRWQTADLILLEISIEDIASSHELAAGPCNESDGSNPLN